MSFERTRCECDMCVSDPAEETTIDPKDAE